METPAQEQGRYDDRRHFFATNSVPYNDRSHHFDSAGPYDDRRHHFNTQAGLYDDQHHRDTNDSQNEQTIDNFMPQPQQLPQAQHYSVPHNEQTIDNFVTQ